MNTDNNVFVGKKETMNYVLAVVTQFNNGNNEVIIKARGKSISRAVDVAEITKNKFVQDSKVVNIQIDTEDLTTDEGKVIHVSSIEITLQKV